MFSRKVSVYIFRIIFVGLINIVTLYFIAHYMGPVPLGLIGFATSFINMFFIFSELGFGQAHIKRISEGKEIGKCIGTYFTVKSSIIILFTIIIIVTLLIKKYYFHSVFENPKQEKIIYLLLIPIIITQISTIPIRTFEAKKEAIKASIPDILASFLKAPITISVALFGLGVFGLVFARIFSAVILIIFSFILLKYPIKRPNITYFKSYFNYAYKMIILTVLMKIAIELDKLMIGTYVSIKAVGIYFSIQSIVNFLSFIPTSIGRLLFPTISEEYSKGNLEDIDNYVRQTEKYMGLMLIPVCIILCFFAKSIIHLLLGEEFISARTPFILLSIYFLINGMRKPIASKLAGTDRAGTLAILATISVVINIIFNFILIPKELFGIKLAGMGMNGAAAATLISGIVYSVLCRIAANKKFVMPNIGDLL